MKFFKKRSKAIADVPVNRTDNVIDNFPQIQGHLSSGATMNEDCVFLIFVLKDTVLNDCLNETE